MISKESKKIFNSLIQSLFNDKGQNHLIANFCTLLAVHCENEYGQPERFKRVCDFLGSISDEAILELEQKN